MGRPAIEMIGKTFGEWKVLERAPHRQAQQHRRQSRHHGKQGAKVQRRPQVAQIVQVNTPPSSLYNNKCHYTKKTTPVQAQNRAGAERLHLRLFYRINVTVL